MTFLILLRAESQERSAKAVHSHPNQKKIPYMLIIFSYLTIGAYIQTKQNKKCQVYRQTHRVHPPQVRAKNIGMISVCLQICQPKDKKQKKPQIILSKVWKHHSKLSQISVIMWPLWPNLNQPHLWSRKQISSTKEMLIIGTERISAIFGHTISLTSVHYCNRRLVIPFHQRI